MGIKRGWHNVTAWAEAALGRLTGAQRGVRAGHRAMQLQGLQGSTEAHTGLRGKIPADRYMRRGYGGKSRGRRPHGRGKYKARLHSQPGGNSKAGAGQRLLRQGYSWRVLRARSEAAYWRGRAMGSAVAVAA